VFWRDMGVVSLVHTADNALTGGALKRLQAIARRFERGSIYHHRRGPLAQAS
jgi:hypothetical protein